MSDRNSIPPARYAEPTAEQRAGNRFGVAAVALALAAGLCAAVPGLRSAAWALGPMGMILGGSGLALFVRGRATNRDDALLGVGLAFVVVMVLFGQLAATVPISAVPIAPMP